MADSFATRLRNAWNVFTSREQVTYRDYGPTYFNVPGQHSTIRVADKTIINSIYNRISLDVAAVDIRHAKLDEFGRFSEIIKSPLNKCLQDSANIDQTGRNLIQDCVLTMLEKGCAVLVPITRDRAENLVGTGYDIFDMRVGEVVQWYPYHARVSVFNEKNGRSVEVTVRKEDVAIIQNPFYSVINAPNGTMQRLLKKLSLLDAVDEANSSGKLDLIIQLPYTVRTDLRKEQANARRKEIEDQLHNSKYGVAYTDGTEKITQLNRPVENNLWKQIESLTAMLYSQLGLTEDIINGTANDATMLNYYNRTIDVFLTAITEEMKRKFISEESSENGQSIVYFRNQLKFVPFADLAKLADALTRNEILTSNEIRQAMGFAPSSDPNADILRNKNLNPTGETIEQYSKMEPPKELDAPTMTYSKERTS